MKQDNLKFQAASKSYGRGLWESQFEILAGKCLNTPNKALASDANINEECEEPGLYYAESKFGGLQLVVKYPDRGWCYAGIIRDKDGEPVMSKKHNYTVKEVKCMSRFEVPGVKDANGAAIVLEPGFVTVKAYAEA